MLSLGAIPWSLARRDPEMAALRVDGRTLTARQLDAAAAGIAAELTRAGVTAGRRVVLLCGNGFAFPAAYYGALRLGAVVAPLSTASADAELRAAVRAMRPAALVSDLANAGRAAAALAAAGGAGLLVVEEGGRAGRGRGLPLELLVEHRRDDPLPVPGTAPAVVLGTSGTTGLPKRAVHSHAGLVLNARAVAGEMLGLGPGDRQLGTLPLAHSYGMSAVLNASLMAGCGVVLLARFEAGAALAAVEAEGVTVLQGVPTMLAQLAAARPAAAPVAALRRVVVSGAPLPAGLAADVHARLCPDVVERWGLTECSPLTMRAVPAGGGDHGDVGRPLRGVCVRVAGDPGPGATGELEAAAPTMFSGYLGDRRATAAVMSGGFLRTGDLGSVDAEGRVRLSGRLKDVIVRGGNNVAALEVERALEAHPAVLEAAVVGVPDEDLGEEVAAAVVLDPRQRGDEEALAAHCRARLSAYKVPRRWAVVAQLPRTSTGKVRKGELGRLFAME